MLPRDVLLTLATHGFFSPKWSRAIRRRMDPQSRGALETTFN
jgi:hypothetical protein